MGIATDIMDGIRALLCGGEGIHRSQSIPGDGLAHSIIQDADRIVPSFTVVNTGSNMVYLGYKGVSDATFPLFPASPSSTPPVSGGAFTFVWTNPHTNGLIAMCKSGSPSTIDIMG